MSLTIHRAAVPVLLRGLGNLAGVLEKGRAHAEAQHIDASVLLASRLYPDMFPLSRQVQVVSDTAKGAGARLAGLEPPKFADTESSFPELAARLAKTEEYLKSLEPRQFAQAENHPVVLEFPNATLRFPTGWDYLLDFVLPNFFFHCTTAYGILRHSGVKLGKGDYLGPPPA